MSNRLVRPEPLRARHLAGPGGPVPRGLRSPKGRPNPVPPNCTVPYKPSRELDAKGVQLDAAGCSTTYLSAHNEDT